MVGKLIRRLNSKIGRFLCRYRGSTFVEGLVVEVSAILQDLNNVNWDMSANGEKRALGCLAVISPKLVFDVGANVGGWSKIMAEMYPACEIHAFEIVPATFELLSESVKSYPKIKANNIGLSDEIGSITLNCSDQDSTVATACKIEGMDYHNSFYGRTIECDVSTGNRYVSEHSIDGIDYLKVDVEGMDLKVLKGFGDKLLSVKAIQFEYGIFNISSHDLLSDFFNYLEGKGFIVGKVYPTHVHFFKYHFMYEDFGGNNYIAVQSCEHALIDALSRHD